MKGEPNVTLYKAHRSWSRDPLLVREYRAWATEKLITFRNPDGGTGHRSQFQKERVAGMGFAPTRVGAARNAVESARNNVERQARQLEQARKELAEAEALLKFEEENAAC